MAGGAELDSLAHELEREMPGSPVARELAAGRLGDDDAADRDAAADDEHRAAQLRPRG